MFMLVQLDRPTAAFTDRMRTDEPPGLIEHMHLVSDHFVKDRMEAAVPGDGILAGTILDERVTVQRILREAVRRTLIERRYQRPQLCLFDFLKDKERYAKRRLMDPLVLAFQPSGQRTPDIIDRLRVPGTEEVFLYKANRVLDRLCEHSDNRSYPQTFFIRTFGCNAY